MVRLVLRLFFIGALCAPLLALADATSHGNAEPAEPANPPAHAKVRWELSVSAPAADGSRSVLAALPADAPIASGFALVTPKLVLRYRSGQTVAYVAFDKFLGDDTVAMTVTFGADPPVKQTWLLSSDGRTAFVPGDALAFIRHLQQVTSFSIRIEAPKHEPVVVSFSPRQTDLVIKALLSAGVKYGG